MELIEGLVLPCTRCKCRRCVYLYTNGSKYMSVCNRCGAVLSIGEEEYIVKRVVQKEVTVEREVVVVQKVKELQEIEVGVCDRPGCEKQYDPSEGGHISIVLGVPGGTNRSVLDWDLCPNCIPDFEKYLVKRLSKTHNRWDSTYKDNSSEVSIVEVPDGGEGGSF